MRFPEFSDIWRETTIGNILKIGNGRDYKHLEQGNIPVFGTGGLMTNVNQYLYNGETVFIGRKGTINKPFYYEGKFWTVDTLFYTHSYVNVTAKFILSLFDSINWLKYNEASGVPSLSKSTLEKISINITSISEQNKISTFLSLIDERILTQKKIIEGLITLKTQSRSKLFMQIIKGNYKSFTVGEILNYEQPTKYIVSSTDYSSDKSLIPVLTANKAFILGYTNDDWGIYNKGKCIILDDFTMDLKYVDFDFKIKSSAIKLLTPKKDIDLKFIFEYFSFLNLSSNEHKRHYISEIQSMSLGIPPLEVQNTFSTCLSKIDEKINLESELLTQYENQKKYLLQNLFV